MLLCARLTVSVSVYQKHVIKMNLKLSFEQKKNGQKCYDAPFFRDIRTL